jgi:hypothetical protein
MKITCVQTSIQSPWQNGVAERSVGSCRRDLLDHVIALERELIVGYYLGDEEEKSVYRQKLAARSGLTMMTIRVRANRVRAKLQNCVRVCLASRRKKVVEALQKGDEPHNRRPE